MSVETGSSDDLEGNDLEGKEEAKSFLQERVGILARNVQGGGG